MFTQQQEYLAKISCVTAGYYHKRINPQRMNSFVVLSLIWPANFGVCVRAAGEQACDSIRTLSVADVFELDQFYLHVMCPVVHLTQILQLTATFVK